MVKLGVVDTIDGNWYTVWFEDTKSRTVKIRKLDHVDEISVNDKVVVGLYDSSSGVILGKISG